MRNKDRLALRAGAVLAAVGVVLLLLPVTWIEAKLGKAPDGGDGSLERLLGLVPLTIGIGIALPVLVRSRRARALAEASR